MATQPTNSSIVNEKSLRELTELLIRDAQVHEGLYDLSIELQITISTFAHPSSEPLPGALIGVKSVGLMPTSKASSTAVDAGAVNPRRRPISKKSGVRRVATSR